MRGIQINNYFNNHITLSGKKNANELQAHPNSSRQKQIQGQGQIQDSHQGKFNQNVGRKSSAVLNGGGGMKKRVNTLAEGKKQTGAKRSISTDKHRNATSGRKRQQQEHHSQEEQHEHQRMIDMSQRKLRVGSRAGLGKRSKSTIIKTNQISPMKEGEKRQGKAKNVNTNESLRPKTSRRKKSGLVQELAKEVRVGKSGLKSDIRPATSREYSKKEKEKGTVLKIIGKDKKKVKSQVKDQQLAQQSKIKKIVGSEVKIKKSGKIKIIEQINKKAIEQIPKSKRSDRQDQQTDPDFLQAMNNLEKMLTSVKSKQKLKKQLKLINDKLKQFKVQIQKSSQSSKHDKYEHLIDQSGIGERPFDNVQLINSQLGKSQLGNSQIVKNQQDSQSWHSSIKEQQMEEIQEENNIEVVARKNQIKNRGNFFNDVVKSNQDAQISERRREIQELKKFKGESTKIMQKISIKKQKNINKLTLPLYNEPQPQPQLHNQHESTHIRDDKYPILQTVRSPKYDETQLMGVISLKQQYLSSKHDKMSELIKRMFDNQIVSPRSYQWQLKSLRKKYEDEQFALRNFKQQAEKLSIMLGEIKRDKEDIQDIDQLIRGQQWSQAAKLVKKSEVLEKIVEKEENHWQQDQNKNYDGLYDNLQVQKEQGWSRVIIHKNTNGRLNINNLIKPPSIVISNPDDIDEQCGGTQQSIDLNHYQVRQDTSEECNQRMYEQFIGETLDDQKLPSRSIDDTLKFLQTPQVSNVAINIRINTLDLCEHLQNDKIDNNSQNQYSNISPSISKNGSSLLSINEHSQKKGFGTNLYFIKEYCIALCEYVRDNDIYRYQFKINIEKPICFDLKKIFQSFRKGEDTNQYIFMKREGAMAISMKIWMQFNSQYQALKFNSIGSKPNQKAISQKEMELIFVKMILDAMNESLNYEKPGGENGCALPWKEHPKHLKNMNHKLSTKRENQQNFDLIFGLAIARIIQWGSCLCGFLPDTVDLQNTQIDDNYVNHIRQTRMALLLQKMMTEEAPLLINFELQESETYFNLSEMLMEQMQLQLAREMIAIEVGRQSL